MPSPITLYDQIASNNRKTLFLVLLFPILLICIITAFCTLAVFIINEKEFTDLGVYTLISQFPNIRHHITVDNIHLWSAIGHILPFVLPVTGLSLIWLLIAYNFGGQMMLGFSGAKETSFKEHPQLFRMVENVAIAAGLPMPKLFIIADNSLNAFATGKSPKDASIALTSGIIKKLEPIELEAVIAHEMAHIGNRDIRLNMLIITGLSFCALFADIIRRFCIRRFCSDSKKQSQLVIFAFFIMVALTIFNVFIAPIIHMAVSRKREYAADATGALIVRNPLALASALEKISQDARVENLDNQPTMSKVCIANPCALHKNKISNLFATHPPIEKRIAILKHLAGKI